MIRFSEEKVLLLHQLIVGGTELYPTKEEKGARLGFSLISNMSLWTRIRGSVCT